MKSGLGKVTSTKELKALQRAFFQIITRPLGRESSMKSDSRAAAMVLPSPTLSPHERLELYARQYWWRVLDSLKEDFPGVLEFLGEKRFSALLVRYLSKHPSTSFTLRNLGRKMPQFLLRDKTLPLGVRRKAAAIASVEWAEIEVFDGPSFEELSTQAVQQRRDKLRLTIQPYVQLLSLPYTVDTFLGTSRTVPMPAETSNVRGRKEVSKRSSKLKKALRTQKCHVAIYRIGANIRLARLDGVELDLFRELQKGGSLAQIFGRLLKKRKSLPPEKVQAAFQRLSSFGMIGIE